MTQSKDGKPSGRHASRDHVREWFAIGCHPDAFSGQDATVSHWRTKVIEVCRDLPAEAEPADFSRAIQASPEGAGDLESRVAGHATGADPRRGSPVDLLQLDLVEVADAIAGRQLSSVEVTTAALDRLEATHEVCNVAAGIDREGALAAARAADAAIAGGASGPLLGVPLAHKDLIYRAGRPVDCGAKVRGGFIPAATAPALQRLDAAGAIDVGRLHTTEFALDPTGCNPHFGPCRNPWDPGRLAGGSSGGPAAAVAARSVFGALGTDTGGSIRIPSALCGVTGLRPTHGLVSRAGVMPLSFTLDQVGPIARTARDCARLLSVIADPGSGVRNAVERLDERPPTRVTALRIGVPRAYFRASLAQGIGEALDASLGVFEELGASLREVPDFDYDALNVLGSIVIRSEASADHATWLGESPDLYSPEARLRLEEGLAIPAAIYIRALSVRGALLRAFLDTVMADVDVLHVPVSPVGAPLADRIARDAPYHSQTMRLLTGMTRPLSFLGLPALAVPCGFTDAAGRRVPTAFQLVGRPRSDAGLLAVAHAYQQATDWHLASPG